MSATPPAAAAVPLPAASYASAPDTQPERIGVLDVLRGIALFGMFVVHFSEWSKDPGGGFGHFYQRVVQLFFVNRFYTIFAILFGVGFAVQLRRADTRGSTFIPRYVRRLLALAVFGFIAEALTNFKVLLGYAIWGLPLLLVRRWSTRALVIALLLCATSQSIYLVTRATYATVGGTGAQFDSVQKAEAAERMQNTRTVGGKTRSTDYRAVVAARIQLMQLRHLQGPFLPAGGFTLFLIGLLGLRLGVFEDPRRHRRLIAGTMIFGIVSWAAWEWLFPLHVAVPPTWPLPLQALSTFATTQPWNAIGSLGGDLAFTYIGAVLLLVAHNPVWLRRLSAFGITGRMALTNYMLQIFIIDYTFNSYYGLGVRISSAYAPLAALALFAVVVAFSRWWLSRYLYGPLEWLWRSATYARWQPMRRAVAPVGDT